MIKKKLNYVVEFGLSKYDKNKMTAVYPFKTVIQTSSQTIEKKCKITWPNLLMHSINTPQDNLDLVKMKAYILRTLSTADKNDIHDILYKEGWLAPFVLNDKITTVKILKGDCKMWSDPMLPYLELNGEITVSIPKLLDAFLKHKWVESTNDSKLTSEHVKLKLMRSIPLLIRYTGAQDPLNILLDHLSKEAKKQNTGINKLIKKVTKFKNIHTFKFDISWGNDKSIIIYKYTDAIKIFKAKVKRNPIKYAVGAYAAYKVFSKK